MLRIGTEEQPQLRHSLWSLRIIECFVLLPLLLCGTYTRCQWKGRCNGEGWIKEIVASCHGPQCLRIQHHKAVQRGTWKIPYRRRTATYTLTATHWRMEGSLMKTLHSLSAGAHRVLESPLWSPPYLWCHHSQTSTISSSTRYPAKCKMWSIAANRYQAKATLPEPCLILSWPKSWGTEVCLSGVTLSKQSSLRVDWCWVCSLTRLCIDWFGRQRSFRWVNDKKNTAWGWDDEVSSLFCKMECKEWTIDREW